MMRFIRILGVVGVGLFLISCNGAKIQEVPANESTTMHNWLVTVQASADLEIILKEITKIGGLPDKDYEPVPMGETEVMIRVFAPKDFPDRCKSIDAVIEAYPDSEMQLF